MMKEGSIEISMQKDRLDIEMISNFLNNESYWAKGRSKRTIVRSIENSLCFGVYFRNKQIGFARVVTDFAVFAWILDVFILSEFRGYGYSMQLMEYVISLKELENIQRWGLATDDAHGLYQKFGFTALKQPQIMMEKVQLPK